MGRSDFAATAGTAVIPLFVQGTPKRAAAGSKRCGLVASRAGPHVRCFMEQAPRSAPEMCSNGAHPCNRIENATEILVQRGLGYAGPGGEGTERSGSRDCSAFRGLVLGEHLGGGNPGKSEQNTGVAEDRPRPKRRVCS